MSETDWRTKKAKMERTFGVDAGEYFSDLFGKVDPICNVR